MFAAEFWHHTIGVIGIGLGAVRPAEDRKGVKEVLVEMTTAARDAMKGMVAKQH